MDEQIELMDKILAININIVTCGECGSVILHKLDKEWLQCPYCNMQSDICDFPDLITEIRV